MTEEKRQKACYVRMPELRMLEHSCIFIYQALGNQPYLVGSCLERPNFHDVDVRVIFDDEKFERFFGKFPGTGESSAFWSLLCTSITVYLCKQTGLPIDFQIQKRSKVKESDWDKERFPLGLFITNQKYAPPWTVKPEKLSKRKNNDKEPG